MPVVFIRHIGANLAYIQSLDAVDPGFGGGIGAGGDPGYGIPDWGGHPGNRPPGSWAGRPDNTLPGGPGHPDTRPPGHPPVVAAGQTLVLVRDPEGIWHYATMDNSTPPPRPVPVPPPDHISNRPPGSGVEHPSGQPVPPTATPTRK